MEIRNKEQIIVDFNTSVRNLINILKCKMTGDNLSSIERLEKRLSLFRSTAGNHAVIEEAGPYLFKYTKEIVSRNENFFLHLDVEKDYGDSIKENRFIYDFIASMRKQYKESRQVEKDKIYEIVRKLHDNYIEYLIACRS